MMATRTSLTANELDEASLKKVFGQITRDVPVGFGQHDDRDARTRRGEGVPEAAADRSSRSIRGIEQARRQEVELGAPARHARRRQPLHRGVPGRGESRLGDAALGQPRHRQRDRHAISSSWPSRMPRETSLQLPDRDLAYFPEGAQHFDDYVEAVGWAQDYARANREEMMDLVLDAMRRHLPSFERHRRRGQLPPQLRRARAALRRARVAHAQGRDPRRRRRARHHSRQHGHAQLHRARQGLGRELPLVRAWRGPRDEPQRRRRKNSLVKTSSSKPRASSAARTRA